MIIYEYWFLPVNEPSTIYIFGTTPPPSCPDAYDITEDMMKSISGILSSLPAAWKVAQLFLAFLTGPHEAAHGSGGEHMLFIQEHLRLG